MRFIERWFRRVWIFSFVIDLEFDFEDVILILVKDFEVLFV